MSALLMVAVCAVLAGASSFAAINDWLQDLDRHARDRLGIDRIPSATTMWRLLQILKGQHYGGSGSRSRPVWAKKASISSGRY
ncbi:transposase family protein, partial [Saccharothrix carnea]|uniref:transposase family protein n=1 Tax=Saccharothrix carnea TaxID=1280637 RepID=UPI0036393077